MKNKIKYLTLFFLLFPFFLFPSKKVFADSISPFINEVSLKENERTRESLTFTNESDLPKEILLRVYGYNLKTEEIDDNVPLLLRVDTDTFLIQPKESKDLPYEIVLPENIKVGTYFNLLVLESISQAKNSTITTSPSISQIVRVDIYPVDSTDNTISSIPADISLEVISKGIPWIKGVEIKYSYSNISNYILQPQGEIQIFNQKQNTEPIYLKINKDENLLYPGDVLSETLKTNTWNIYDLIYERVVLGRFYNGVDRQYQGDQTTIESFKEEIAIVGIVTLFLFIIFRESSKGSGRKMPKDYDEENEEE